MESKGPRSRSCVDVLGSHYAFLCVVRSSGMVCYVPVHIITYGWTDHATSSENRSIDYTLLHQHRIVSRRAYLPTPILHLHRFPHTQRVYRHRRSPNLHRIYLRFRRLYLPSTHNSSRTHSHLSTMATSKQPLKDLASAPEKVADATAPHLAGEENTPAKIPDIPTKQKRTNERTRRCE
jgi:hypothetical protein